MTDDSRGQEAPITPRTLRTPEQPMAFTPGELLRGAAAAWVVFIAILSVVVLGSALSSAARSGTDPSYLWSLLAVPVMVVLFAGLPAAVVMVVGLLAVRPLATAMRRIPSVSVHLSIYTGIGLLVGVLFLTLATGSDPFSLLLNLPWNLFVASPALAATIALPAGWWWSMHRARRADARAADSAWVVNPAARAAREAHPDSEEPAG